MGPLTMATIKLQYVNEFVDRHGHVRRYFRRKGQKRIALPGSPGSPEFMRAYGAALEGKTVHQGPSKPGTIEELVCAYYGSHEYRALKPVTRQTYRQQIELFRKAHGHRITAQMTRDDVVKLMDAAPSSGTANNVLKTVQRLMRWGLERGKRKDDPTAGIKRLKDKGGWLAWTDEDVSRFAERHAIGTRARLAMSLLLYTAQRRADVVGMGWQHVAGSRIAVSQSKTGERLTIPIHPDLARILAETPRTQMTFMVGGGGKPLTPKSFGDWFGARCREAGLMQHNCHGLRKAAARRLAEAGCSANEIMSITGHRSLKEVARYTDSARQPMLAETAIGRLRG